MRLCLVSNVQSVHTRRWAEYFIGKGYEVDVLSYTEGDIEGAATHYIGPFVPPTGVNLPAIRQLGGIVKKVRSLMKTIKPDIVHAHYLQDSGFFAALSRFHPLVVSAWGSDVLVHLYRNKIYRVMTLYVLRRANAVHSVAKHLTKKLIDLGVPQSKIITEPMGVDQKEFNPRAEPIMKGNNLVVSTRSLESIYNVKLLIKAVPHIIKRVKDAKVAIIGHGEDMEELRALADKLNLGESVEFVGTVGHGEIPRWLNASKVYVSTSLSDGTSASLLESMACGIFPVVTNIPACREWIEDGKNGFLVPTNDSKLLARRIVDALRDDGLRARAGNINLKLVGERGNWQNSMKKMEDLYRRVLAGALK
ncbi:MAG: glycosyltransferase [Thermoplasmata archaeon]|nr:glycosyltransferase [Thermoplasmata archaeon]